MKRLINLVEEDKFYKELKIGVVNVHFEETITT